MSSDTCKRMMSDGDARVNTATDTATDNDTDVVPATVRAIVAGHGSFASGIISAVEQITGKKEPALVMPPPPAFKPPTMPVVPPKPATDK